MCWSDKKGEVRRKTNAIKAARLKTSDGNNEEMKLTPLEEKIVLLIAPDAAGGLGVEESELRPKVQELVIPKVEVCPDSPENGSFNIIATSQPISQESNQTNSEECLQSDTASRLSESVESNQPESLPPHPKTTEVRPRYLLRREYVNPKVEDCPASPANESSNVMETSQPFGQESNQTELEEHLRPDSPPCPPNTEESRQPESSQSFSQPKLPENRPRTRARTKPVVLKSDNAQKLVDGQTKMAAALTRCAAALEKRNEIQEKALEVEKRKVDAQERLLKIKKEKADAFIEILSILKDKI
ncbi:unnamed protein product [Larinioides sclopetarius]|uniref:Uncharacterized protein n=1 Tax=Larinioides sclopetarius TaxID=280406 RepID=A0AAV2BPT7_9ARAC